MTIREVSDRYGITQDALRYYERAGMIPPVGRTAGGIRDYRGEDLGWVELALCMRSAGLPVEAIAEYVRLCRQGDSTIEARLELLTRQRDILLERQRQTEETLERLGYKISRYRQAMKTGHLDFAGRGLQPGGLGEEACEEGGGHGQPLQQARAQDVKRDQVHQDQNQCHRVDHV